MPHPIYKFRLPLSTVVHNSVDGGMPAREHILGAAKIAKVPSRNVRDRSTAEEIDIAVTFASDIEKSTFLIACGVQPSTILRG